MFLRAWISWEQALKPSLQFQRTAWCRFVFSYTEQHSSPDVALCLRQDSRRFCSIKRMERFLELLNLCNPCPLVSSTQVPQCFLWTSVTHLSHFVIIWAWGLFPEIVTKRTGTTFYSLLHPKRSTEFQARNRYQIHLYSIMCSSQVYLNRIGRTKL